jgi:hypothetical protein
LLVALASLLAAVGEPAVETGAAGAVRHRRCAPEGYGLEWKYVPPTAKTPHAGRLTVGWLTAMEKRRSCLLHTAIRLTIADSGGIAFSTAWKVNSVRRPWSDIVHTWVWRNWCDIDPEAQPTVEFSVPAEKSSSRTIIDPPDCVNPSAASMVTSLGTGTKYVRPWNRIPPHILPKGVPSPLHYALINVKNAWLVSDGYTLVAVYAGSPGGEASIGRFAIIRQNAVFGVQYEPPDIVDVGRVGVVKISRAPRGRSHETTAQHAKLAFVAADGTTGFLELTGDHIRITGGRRPRAG